MANPTFWGSPKAQRVKNFELFWGFLGLFWAGFGLKSGRFLGPFRRWIWDLSQRGLTKGQKARIFGVFGGFLTLNPWALLALANETHPSCVPRHVFRGLGCLG